MLSEMEPTMKILIKRMRRDIKSNHSAVFNISLKK